MSPHTKAADCKTLELSFSITLCSPVADILWLRSQVQYIERRHGVTARQFQEAWDDPDREELAEEEDSEWGSYFRSVGAASDGRLIEMG